MASITVRSGRFAAAARTAGETPCAARTTVAPSGTSFELGHEDRALGLEVGHDVGVVDDLTAYVHRAAEPLEGALDDLDGALDAGAERTGAGQEHVVGTAGPRPALERCPDAEK